MDAETARAYLRTLPHVVETASQTKKWGNKLVFRAGEPSAGGTMFAQIDFEDDRRAILSFAASPERFYELTERNGILPTPYRARIYWVALQHWNARPNMELKSLLSNARETIFAKLPKQTRARLSRS